MLGDAFHLPDDQIAIPHIGITLHKRRRITLCKKIIYRHLMLILIDRNFEYAPRPRPMRPDF